MTEAVVAKDAQTRPIKWLDVQRRPVDFGGPVDVPYEPLDREGLDGFDLRRIERIAAKYPNKLAVDDGLVRLTYADLLDRAYGVTQRISDLVPPGGVFASVIHSGALAPVVILGALTSGRTLIPIDAGHPIERQRALFAETHASAVIVAEGVEIDDSFIPAGMARIVVDVTKPTGAAPSRTPFEPGAPILVMFTSGSTGRPKGLAIGMRTTEIVPNFIARSHFNPNDVFISLASMSQTGAGDLIGLAAGATVRICDMRRNGISETLRVIREEGVTVLSFVPSVLRTFMAMPGIEDVFHKLRILDLHGERILASDVELFRSKLPKECFISVTYGSTEAHGVFSWFVQDDKIEGPVVPLGYITSQKQVAILDENGEPVAEGEVGDLVVRGPMAMGSWQGGQVTGARFIKDPEDPSLNIYPMGDQVRQRPDGLFEFVGRRDRQVKIRALWVDLGDIEAALRAAPGVVDAVVIAHAHEGAADTLAAFITLEDPANPPQAAALRRAVVAATAEHMAPGLILVVAEIPRLANYKPDMVRLDQMLSQPTGRLA
jgi:acyl-coenzyme A synthetase/AMP-(fatty) acid ligase